MASLDERLDKWVEQGLISADQAVAIRETETQADAEAKTPRRGRVSLAAETLGYFGAALLIGAFFTAFGGVWRELGLGLRITILAVITLLLVAMGQALRGNRESALDRLSGVLWFASAGVFASLAYVVGVDAIGIEDDTSSGVWLGLASAAYAWPLWRLRCAALQQIAVFAGLVTTLFSFGFSQLALNGETAAGWLVALFGGGWLVSAEKGWVPPRRTGEALGSLGALTGVQTTGFDDATSMFVAIVIAVVIMGYGVAAGRNIPLGLGAAGLFVFVPQFITEAFGASLGAAGSVAIAGALITGAAVFIGRSKRTRV